MKSVWVMFSVPLVVVGTCAVIAQGRLNEIFLYDSPEVAKSAIPVEVVPMARRAYFAEDVQFDEALDAGQDLQDVLVQLENYEIDLTGWEKYANEATRCVGWSHNVTSIDVVDGEVQLTVISAPLFIQGCRVRIWAAFTEEVFRLRDGKLQRIKHTPPREGAGWVEV